MKLTLTLLFVLLISSNAFAQKEYIGKWKLVAITDFFGARKLVTDSAFFMQDYWSGYVQKNPKKKITAKDSSALNKKFLAQMMEFRSVKIELRADKTFKRTAGTFVVEGTYVIDSKKKELTLLKNNKPINTSKISMENGEMVIVQQGSDSKMLFAKTNK